MNIARAFYCETIPVIEAADSGTPNPFLLRFSIRNQSPRLSARNVKWRCVVDEFVSEHIFMHNNTVAAATPETIEPAGVRFYACHLEVMMRGVGRVLTPTFAILKFTLSVDYQTLWLPRKPAAAQFSWDANRWVRERPA